MQRMQKELGGTHPALFSWRSEKITQKPEESTFLKTASCIFHEENMRPTSLVLFFLFTANMGTAQREVLQAGAHSRDVLFRIDSTTSAQLKMRKCAHIVIYEVPGIDPKLMKTIPGDFTSSMPVLHVPPPCYQDSISNQARFKSAAISK